MFRNIGKPKPKISCIFLLNTIDKGWDLEIRTALTLDKKNIFLSTVRQRFDSFLLCFVKTHIVYSTDQVSYFTELKMRGLFMCMIVVAAGVYAEDGACYSHLSVGICL